MQRVASHVAGVVSKVAPAVPAARYALPRKVSERSLRGIRWSSTSSLGTIRFAGLRQDAELISEVKFHNSPGTIPVLRVMGEDGKLVPGASLPFSVEQALDMYRTMVKVSVVDKIMNSLQRQGRVSFYMTSGGEEATTVGSIAALSPEDVCWPQYRELGAFMQRGFTIQQVVDQCLGKCDEPGKGRQMPVHYVDANIQMQAVTSPLTTQVPQAVGAGYAFRAGGERRCGVSYFGDGAASEGDFAVALNFAATLKAQAIFLCRNNGWAISTPSKEQYAGDGIAVRGIAYGMNAMRVDGNDLAAVYLATKKARELCVEEGEPVIIEMMTYRRGHHSTSDDATRYREGAETKSMAREGLEPISRMRLFLDDLGKWSDAQQEELEDSTKDEVMSCLKIAEGKKYAAVKEMFRDVWHTPPAHLQQQEKELFEHIDRHKEHFAERLTQFEK